MLTTNGRLDIAFDPKRKYYGNGKKRPNAHCKWRTDTMLPGWYDDEKTYQQTLRTKTEVKYHNQREKSHERRN